MLSNRDHGEDLCPGTLRQSHNRKTHPRVFRSSLNDGIKSLTHNDSPGIKTVFGEPKQFACQKPDLVEVGVHWPPFHQLRIQSRETVPAASVMFGICPSLHIQSPRIQAKDLANWSSYSNSGGGSRHRTSEYRPGQHS